MENLLLIDPNAIQELFEALEKDKDENVTKLIGNEVDKTFTPTETEIKPIKKEKCKKSLSELNLKYFSVKDKYKDLRDIEYQSLNDEAFIEIKIIVDYIKDIYGSGYFRSKANYNYIKVSIYDYVVINKKKVVFLFQILRQSLKDEKDENGNRKKSITRNYFVGFFNIEDTKTLKVKRTKYFSEDYLRHKFIKDGYSPLRRILEKDGEVVDMIEEKLNGGAI
jgi:hypothetical protein